MVHQIGRRLACLAAIALSPAVLPAADVPAPGPDEGIEAASPHAGTEDAGDEVAGGAGPAESGGNGDGVSPSAPSGHPYEAIIIRNAFGLREPPPPAPPPVEPPPQVNAGALKLTGITTLLGKRAMFAFNDGRTNMVSSLVREGEWDPVIKDLEVLEIDAVARAVRVRFGGKEMRMDFVKDGLMPPTNQVALAGVPAMPRPGTQVAMANLPQRPGGVAGQPGVHVLNAPAAGLSRTLPARPTRLGSGITSGSGVGTVISSGGGISGGAPDPASALPVLTPEQQNQLLREQINFGQQINLDLPPVPPVPGLEDLAPPPTTPPVLPGEVPQFPFPQVPR